jgi:hypothetical protein
LGVDDQFWNRDELHKDVWATPMWTLATKYGISDVGLAKVCRKLMIPLPGRGYWAKKDAGHAVESVPLSPIKDKIWLRKPPPPKEKPPLENFASEAEQAQIEKLERSSGELVLKKGSLSHPLIVQARGVLGRATANNRNILQTQQQCLDVRVSKGSLDRALRIMAGLIATMEEEGFSITVGDGHHEQTVVMVYGQQIKLGLVEKVDRVELAVAPPGGVLERVLTYGSKPATFEPSGQLSIEVWQPWDADPKRWKDRKAHPLEELLRQVAAGFIRIALKKRSEQEKRAAEERVRRQRDAERAELERSIKVEHSKVRALRHAAANWIRAEQVRSFLTAARESAERNGQSVAAGTAFGDWLEWAEQQANRIDPLRESPASIFDRRREVEPEHVAYYGYRKPEPGFRFPKPIWRID